MTHITDLHSHPTFKPYNNQNEPGINLWDPVPEKKEHFDALPKAIKPTIETTERSSQCNLNALVRGKVRGVFFVIHPIERGWLDRRKQSPHPLRRKLIKAILKPVHLPHLAAALSGIPIDKAKAIIQSIKDDAPVNYYKEETYPEYQYLQQSQSITGTNNARLVLVSDYTSYNDVIKNQPNAIAGIITIEGGHSLLHLPRISATKIKYEDLSQEDKNSIKRNYYNNIKKIKGLNSAQGFDKRHTPFWITIVHMYNNFIAGHAKSYKEGTGIMPGMEDLLDQETAMNDGITPLGRQVIERLLKKTDKERRILIDVKHMSLPARKGYYEILEQKRRQGDKIPIIFSHGGVNGYTDKTFRGYDANSDDKDAYVSHWSINLYNEDIEQIYKSGGLIGLAPHEGRVPGERAKAIFDDLRRGIGWDDHRKEFYQEMLRWEYIRLFLTNIFHCVAVINKKKAWDMICIGSDYDGIMDPFDSYRRSADFMRMLGDIKAFLDDDKKGKLYKFQNESRFEMPRNELRRLMFGYSSKQIIEKIAFRNTEGFLKKYFTKEYLGGE